MTLAWIGGALIVLLALCAGNATAQQRDTSQKIGSTVLDRASAHYRFERFVLTSADGKRTWRVNIGIPRKPAPAQGFPSFWMVDGNAALMEFDDALLADLAGQAAPQVLVFIGYDNELRIDSPARTRDYTPTLTPPEEQAASPLSGGADAFLEVIERRLRPEVERRVALDPQARTLWGFSFGGLFTLHTLFTRTGAFQTYAAGSPSLWWQKGYLQDEAERFIAHNAGHPVRVLIQLGGAERVGDYGKRDMNDPRVVAHVARVRATPPDAAMRLAGRLAEMDGVQASYREFPGLGHGPMLRASLLAALHDVAGVKDRSGTTR